MTFTLVGSVAPARLVQQRKTAHRSSRTKFSAVCSQQVRTQDARIRNGRSAAALISLGLLAQKAASYSPLSCLHSQADKGESAQQAAELGRRDAIALAASAGACADRLRSLETLFPVLSLSPFPCSTAAAGAFAFEAPADASTGPLGLRKSGK